MMHNCSYIVPWHKPQSFFSWQTTIYSSISVFKRWIFGGVFWYRALAAVGCEAHHTLGINIPPTFFFIYLLCCNLGPTLELLWLCFYLLSVFLEIIVIIIIIIIIIIVVLKKTIYLMLQNFQFKLSEVKINTELLYTTLSEHSI